MISSQRYLSNLQSSPKSPNLSSSPPHDIKPLYSPPLERCPAYETTLILNPKVSIFPQPYDFFTLTRAVIEADSSEWNKREVYPFLQRRSELVDRKAFHALHIC
eukprot:406947-Amorphochlora_amoeboformis.AAC.1